MYWPNLKSVANLRVPDEITATDVWGGVVIN